MRATKQGSAGASRQKWAGNKKCAEAKIRRAGERRAMIETAREGTGRVGGSVTGLHANEIRPRVGELRRVLLC